MEACILKNHGFSICWAFEFVQKCFGKCKSIQDSEFILGMTNFHDPGLSWWILKIRIKKNIVSNVWGKGDISDKLKL